MKMVKENLTKIMGSKARNKTVDAEAVLSLIMEQPSYDQQELFHFVLTNFGAVDDVDEHLNVHGLTDFSWETLTDKISDEVAKKIRKICKMQISTQEIAQKLWEYLMSFSSREEKIFVLAHILHDDDKLPLLTDDEKEGALTLSADEFDDLTDKLKENITTVLQIMESGMENSFQTASALWHQIKEVKTMPEKAVLLAMALRPFQPEEDNPTDFPGVIDITEDDLKALIDKYTEDKYMEKLDVLNKIFKSDFWEQRTEKAGALLHKIMQESDEMIQLAMLSRLLIMCYNGSSSISIVIGGSSSRLSGLGRLLEGLISSKGGSISEKCDECDKTDCPAHPDF
ncbi:hypothetical protein ACFL2U_02420 [Patescibacteria group bacterium]